jgi:hypothetical protein
MSRFNTKTLRVTLSPGRRPLDYRLMECRCHVTVAKAGREPSQLASYYLFISLSTSRYIA